jgi:hypothetical protein
MTINPQEGECWHYNGGQANTSKVTLHKVEQFSLSYFKIKSYEMHVVYRGQNSEPGGVEASPQESGNQEKDTSV